MRLVFCVFFVFVFVCFAFVFPRFLMFSDGIFPHMSHSEYRFLECFCCTSILGTFLDLLLVDLNPAAIFCKFIALTLECMCAGNIKYVIIHCILQCVVTFFIYQLGLNKSDSIIDIPKGRPQRGRLPYIYICIIYIIYIIYIILYICVLCIYIYSMRVCFTFVLLAE